MNRKAWSVNTCLSPQPRPKDVFFSTKQRYRDHRIKIKQSIQQGRQFSFVSKFVHKNHIPNSLINYRRPIKEASSILKLQLAGWAIPLTAAGC